VDPEPDPDPEYGTFGLGGTDLFVFIIYKVSAISFFNVTHRVATQRDKKD
jgi:hypothetical protein